MSLHTIILNDQLEPVTVTFPSVGSKWSVEKHWLPKVEENLDAINQLSNNYSSLYTIANGPHTETSSNPILQAFVSAYNQHHDIVLSPDDMWMLVCLKFAEYVNSNAEQLRSLFVEHADGKIELSVTDLGKEHEWDEFFDKIKGIIGKNVKGDVCRLLTADFTTTGTLGDWQQLRIKTEQLKVFGNNVFCRYIDGILPIFDEFIQTYQGKVNKEFWIKVCDIKRNTLQGPYTPAERLITGWILQLFDLKAYVAQDPDNINLPNIRVPVKLEDHTTGNVTECYVVGGFHGVYSVENRHKPVMSLSVIKQRNPPSSEDKAVSFIQPRKKRTEEKNKKQTHIPNSSLLLAHHAPPHRTRKDTKCIIM
ncbi:unnamed protein product [Rotaria magnacalcarata]|uniref:Uncharacterized protein n=1 Tax=Rotaria magnacalcarata TaxID=392030 RepID=A0A819N891_9BILA|nr:unnamed protein product [Rotaria magnacalcarata]